MNEKDRELMERYIYEVTRRLPGDQREETAMELRELIGDMTEDSSMDEVLRKLGDPVLFARKYRNENRYLIGPEYYDNYEWVMKIVGIAVIMSGIVSAIVQTVLTSTWGTGMIEDLIGDLVISCVGAFGLVTLIFAVLERQHVKVDLKNERKWSVGELEKEPVMGRIKWTPDQLSPVPDKRGLISRSESVVSVVFAVILGGLLIFAPFLLGAYVFEEDEFVKTIPLFNLNRWNIILPVLLLGLLLGFIDDLIRLVKGCYCRMVMVSSIVSGSLQILTAIVLLKVLPLWNPVFMEEVKTEFGYTRLARWDLMSKYGTDLFSDIILAILLLIYFFEIGNTIYKTIRYGTDLS